MHKALNAWDKIIMSLIIFTYKRPTDKFVNTLHCHSFECFNDTFLQQCRLCQWRVQTFRVCVGGGTRRPGRVPQARGSRRRGDVVWGGGVFINILLKTACFGRF